MDEENNTTENKKSNMTPIVIVLIVAVLGIGGWFMFSQNTATSQRVGELNNPSTNSAGETAVAVTEDISAPITIEGGAFYFKPNEIRVKKGQKVTITFTNAEGFHDFVIDDFNVRTKQLSGGESETIEFIADKAGTFTFYCSVGDHRKKGMEGTLIVEE